MKTCYLCGSAERELAHSGTRDDISIDAMRCKSCGLVYLSSDSHIDDSFYERSGMNGYTDAYERSLRASQPDAERRYEYLKSGIINKRLLDFGCGSGAFISLAENVCECAHGIELDRNMQSHINMSGGKCYGNIQAALDEGKKYNVITLFHVIEHFKDPIRELTNICGLASSESGGETEIIIETPNADDALLSLYDSAEFSGFTYWSCHLYLYNQSTLRSVLEKSGLRVNYIQQVQRYPVSNHLYWLSRGKPGGHDTWRFLNSPGLEKEYENVLRSVGKCDTLIASASFAKKA